MKIRLTYLFTVCFLLCQAFSNSGSVSSGNHAADSFAGSLINTHSAYFSDGRDFNLLPEFSIFIESTDDDDDCSCEKKKQSVSTVGLFKHGNEWKFEYLSGSAKKSCVSKPPVYSFPARYIFIRTIKV